LSRCHVIRKGKGKEGRKGKRERRRETASSC